MLKSPAELISSTDCICFIRMIRFVVGQFFCMFFPPESSVSFEQSPGILRSAVGWFSIGTYLRQRNYLHNADDSFVKVL